VAGRACLTIFQGFADACLSELGSGRMWPASRRRPEDSYDIYGDMESAIERLIDAGKTPEEAEELVAQAVTEVTDSAAVRVSKTLLDTAPKMLRRHGRLARRLERVIRRDWGHALDLYYSVFVASEEAGDNFIRSLVPSTSDQESVHRALIGLHSRACRTALEIHHLLTGGFPMGALARCRTLHELAVYAIVLADEEIREEHPDLAERYMAHQHILALHDARAYQANVEVLGHEPLTTEDVEALGAQRNALVQRFGTPFKEPLGWAAALLDSRRPQFKELEERAALSHLRSYYNWASHEVHADAKGLDHAVVTRGGITYYYTGRTNAGLAEPAHLALISLHQVTVSLLFSIDEPPMTDIYAMKAVQRLIDHAGDALAAAEETVEAAEERYQATLARRQDRDA